ncbi:MAG: hypothetical protein H0W84_00230 [Bacteroidetes bacterium]|nr:hypothetical protein [Bacteroidota bacterium]
MQKITTTEELKSAIQLLEYKQANEWPLLKAQFSTTYESLKPLNILKSTIKDVFSTDLKGDISSAAIGLATGFLAKKSFVGTSHNPLTKILGMLIEIAVANKVGKNADEIKSIGSLLLKKIFNKHEDSEKNEDSEKHNG